MKGAQLPAPSVLLMCFGPLSIQNEHTRSPRGSITSFLTQAFASEVVLPSTHCLLPIRLIPFSVADALYCASFLCTALVQSALLLGLGADRRFGPFHVREVTTS